MNSRHEGFTVISTFSGCGGSSLGYQMAGGKVLLAVEWDENAVMTYKINFPSTPVWQGDIHDLTIDEILEITGLQPGELDIFDGSPPCQGFSTSGKREFCDSRNQLYNEYIRLLRGLKPKVLVLENVSGLVKGKMKLIFRDILTELKSSGYLVRARLMNTMYYGVPQSRQRLIFIGIREDLGIKPCHPAPSGKPISIREALQDCPVGECPELSPKYREIWFHVPNGGTMQDALNLKSHFNDVVKPNPGKPSPTLLRMNNGTGFATLCHWREPRPISINEAKRIHSYPDDYTFVGSHSEKWARIGNSVPPLFMKVIAEHVRDNILSKVAT